MPCTLVTTSYLLQALNICTKPWEQRHFQDSHVRRSGVQPSSHENKKRERMRTNSGSKITNGTRTTQDGEQLKQTSEEKILNESTLLWRTCWKPLSTWVYKIVFSAVIQQKLSTTHRGQRCRRCPGKWRQKSRRMDGVSCGASCLIFQLITGKMHLVKGNNPLE